MNDRKKTKTQTFSLSCFSVLSYFLGLCLVLFKCELVRYFNLAVVAVSYRLPSSRVGVDVDEDLELGGGSFQVLRGVSAHAQAAASRGCWLLKLSYFCNCWCQHRRASARLETRGVAERAETEQNIRTIQHFTNSGKNKRRRRREGPFHVSKC